MSDQNPSWAPLEEQRTLTQQEWLAEGTRRFNHQDVLRWRFQCPVCGHVAAVAELKERGQPHTLIGRECLGRYTKAGQYTGSGPGPCNYGSTGLINLAPITVVLPSGLRIPTFAFSSARDAEGKLLAPTRPGWRLLMPGEMYVREATRQGERLRLVVFESPSRDQWHSRSCLGTFADIEFRRRLSDDDAEADHLLTLEGDFHGVADSPEAAMEALDGWVEGV